MAQPSWRQAVLAAQINMVLVMQQLLEQAALRQLLLAQRNLLAVAVGFQTPPLEVVMAAAAREPLPLEIMALLPLLKLVLLRQLAAAMAGLVVLLMGTALLAARLAVVVVVVLPIHNLVFILVATAQSAR